MFKEIYLHLKKNGIDVYSLAQHKGLCNSNYVVIRELGETKIDNKNLVREDFELLLYVPLQKYSSIANFKEEVKKIMKQLRAYRLVITPVTVVIEEEKQAYMSYLSYKKIRRI